MRKGFTLIEMLIVVVVLVTLMSITFRLSSIGSDASKKNTTIVRLQKLENCLSGYYAAFGTYPPVRLHGSRDIFMAVSEYGIQSLDQRGSQDWKSSDMQAQIEAACRSQPVACRFPYPESEEYNQLVTTVSEALREKAEDSSVNLSQKRREVLRSGFDNGVSVNVGRFDGYKNKDDWRELQLFQFGLMSYLLPRYLVMMNSKKDLYEGGFAQWDGNNNQLCDALTGWRMSWGQAWENVQDRNSRNFASVANMPSQAVCARWMPNLAGIVSCNHDYRIFGIDIRCGDDGGNALDAENTNIEIFRPGGYNNGGGQAYVLDEVNVIDGWWRGFYYYSPPPYQSYTLWSAGANGRTFPPWIPRSSLDSQANSLVSEWVADDIIRMSN